MSSPLGFATDAVVNGEEAVGIVKALDSKQARVVGAPEGLLPLLLEIVAFVDVSTGLGCRRAQRRHRGADAGRTGVSRDVVGRSAGLERGTMVAEDREGEGVEDIGVHCNVSRRVESRGGGAGEPLVKG